MVKEKLDMTNKILNFCCCLGIKLKTKCAIIAYVHLINNIINIVLHLSLLFAASGVFSCDIKDVNWDITGLKWFLLITNFGTHGFYKFPLDLERKSDVFGAPRCYSMMVHIPMLDAFLLIVNVIWINIIINYIKASKKKEPSKVFCTIYTIKMITVVYPLVSYENKLIPIVDFAFHFYFYCLLFLQYNIYRQRSVNNEPFAGGAKVSG